MRGPSVLAADISAVWERGCDLLWKACQRLLLRYLAHQRPLVTSPAHDGKQSAFLCELQPVPTLWFPSFTGRAGHALSSACPTLINPGALGGGSSGLETDCWACSRSKQMPLLAKVPPSPSAFCREAWTSQTNVLCTLAQPHPCRESFGDLAAM